MKLLLALFYSIVIVSLKVAAQDVLNADSLRTELQKSKADTNRVKLLIQLGQQYEANEPDSALAIYSRALKLSESIQYTRGIISYYTNATYVYNILGKHDTSLLLNLRSVELAKRLGDPERLATCLANVGTSYIRLSEYEKAVDYTLQAVTWAEQSNDLRKLSVLYSNLANIYRELRQYPLADSYGTKALTIARSEKNPYQISAALVSLAIVKSFSNHVNEAIPLLNEAVSISRQVNDQYTLLSALLNLNDAQLKLGQYGRMKRNCDETLLIAQALRDPESIVISHRGLGYYYFYANDLKNAEEHASQSLQLAKEQKMLENQGKAYTLLSEIALLKGSKREAQLLQIKSDSIQDVVFSEDKAQNIQRLEVQFRLREKEDALNRERQASELKSLTIRKNQLWILILAILVIAIAVTAWMLTRAANQKKRLLEKEHELSQTKIQQLESEKQLLAGQAVIKGQEEERGRLAKDLHDGLGGMLSGIKFSLSNMKSTVILDADSALVFERSLDMLDHSISELRRVAHNMMPEVLVKFGLEEAVKSYCDSVQQSGIVRVNFQSVGTAYRFASDREVTVYRIIQELMTNVFKHAKANHVLVQVGWQQNSVHITVEDDGVGFDVGTLEKSRGAGWANIRSRVDFSKGKLDVQSAPGNATSVNITLPTA